MKQMLVCDDCGENFLTLRERRNHTVRVHGAGRQHLCSLCGSSFFTDSGKVLSNLHTLGYQINVQQTLLFFEKKYQIQNFEIFILVCFTSYS